MKQQIRSLQDGYHAQMSILAGVLVTADEPGEPCPLCQGPMEVQKSLQRQAMTLTHGPFRVREIVQVCAARCKKDGALVTRRAAALAELIPPRSTVGYDIMVHVGIERFIHHHQREEIRQALEREHGIALSSGEISTLGTRFLIYLEALHKASAGALRSAMARDGGWPLHIDSTCEGGRGTLLVAYSGWRKWVLESWKIPTENAKAIFPRLQETVTRFGPPCAIMRDLGPAMENAAEQLVETLDNKRIPILACHKHFLSDVGTDLLRASHDKLRNLFRQFDVRKDLRAFARDYGRRLGAQMDKARETVRDWLKQPMVQTGLPAGSAGIALLRAYAQWTLDYAADGNDQGFPFDLPYLDFYVRCRNVSWAVESFSRNPPAETKVRRALDRLQRIFRPLNCEVPPFDQTAKILNERSKLFTELRTALRLVVKPDCCFGRTDHEPGVQELLDIRKAVEDLGTSLRQRRPERGPAKDMRQAIDVVLVHLDYHGKYLWGHAIPIPKKLGGGIRLVERTNNIEENLFHTLKHGERRRSGRKNLAHDLERLPPGAILALNLTRPDYVEIVCGSLDRLPQLFAELDAKNRNCSLAAATLQQENSCDAENASLSKADRRLVRTQEIEQHILAAANG